MEPYYFEKSDGIPLHLNEFNRNHHPNVIIPLNSKLIYSYNTNTSLHLELVDKICEYACIKKENLVITNGADEALKLIIDNYSHNFTYIIEPAYRQYERFTLGNGKKVIKIKELMNNYHNNSIVCICIPNLDNKIYSSKILSNIIAKNPTVSFIIDRTYSDYKILLGHKDDIVDLIKFKNVFIVRSFSKAFGMAGLRLGYIMTCPENARNLNSVFNYKNVTDLSKQIGLNILTYKNYYAEASKEMFDLKSKLLYKLRDYHTIDTDCNFIIVKFKDVDELKKFITSVHLKGFTIRNIHKYMNNCARISIGSKEQIEKLISKL